MALTDTLERKASNQLSTFQAPVFDAPNAIGASSLSSSSRAFVEAPPASMSDFTSFIRSLTPNTAPLDNERAKLRAGASETMQKLGTRGDRQLEIEGELGLPEDRKRLNELNLQIAQLSGEFDKSIVNEEGVARPIEFITGRQNFLQKQKAIQVGALTSVAQALQGNIALAEQTAERTVQQEFADEEAELERLKFELEENRSELDRVDKKGAEQLALYVAERSRVLSDAKAERSAVLAMAREAALDGAPNSIVSKIAQSSSQEGALGLLSSWTSGAASVPTYEEWKVANGFGAQSRTPEMEAQLRADYEAAAQASAALAKLSPLAQAVAESPERYYDLTPTMKGELLPELIGAGIKLPRKLSSEQEKAVNIADSGLLALESMDDFLIADDGSLNVSAMQSLNPFSQFSNLRRSVSDAISRLSSGAALTQDEVKFYNQQTPGALDDDPTIRQKQTQLAVFFSGISGNPVSLVSPEGEVYVFDDMFSPQVRRDVRDAIQEGYTLIDY